MAGRLPLLAVMLLFAALARAASDDSVGAHVSSDYFAAGGVLSLAAPVTGDAFLAGGTVKVGNAVGGSLFSAGGRVELDATVGGDLRVAAGEVSLGSAADIGGDTSIAGSSLVLDGTYHGRLKAAGASVTLRGHAMGDVDVRSRDFQIEPGARIDGHLRYRTGRPVTVPADVQIAGGIEYVPSEPHRFGWLRRPDLYGESGRLHWPLFVTLWLIGALYASLFPALAERVRVQIASEPWITIGIGILAALVVPAAALMLAITIIGIPLALLAMLGYLVLIVAGYVAGVLFVADAALSRARVAESGRMLWRLLTFAGILILLAFARRVPVLGAVVNYVIWWAGIGAIVLVSIRRGNPVPATATSPS